MAATGGLAASPPARQVYPPHTIARCMKNFRLFAVSLLATTFVLLAPAQQNEDFAALRAKAEKGNGIAQYNLGLAYAEGRGTATDRLEAYVWLSLARENGARGRALDNLIASFDQSALEMAKQRLAEHKLEAGDKIPVVSTAQEEPEIVATVKTKSTAASGGMDSSGMSQQIAALTADKKQLSEEVAKAWKEIETLNAALSKTEQDARASSGQNLDQKNRELEASLTRTKTELAEQTQKATKLAAAETSRLTPSAEIAMLRNQLTAAQTQATSLNAELVGLRANETKLHDSIAQLEDEKTKVGAAVPAYPDLSTKVGELEAQLTSANRKVEASVQAAAAATQQNTTDLAASAAQILRLQTALTAAKTSAPVYPDLTGKVRDLEASVAESTQKLSAAGEAQSKLQKQLTVAIASAQNAGKAGEETARLSRERDDLSGRMNTLVSENAALRSDRERMQKQIADSGKQLRDSAADASRIKELESQSSGLQTSLSAAQAQVLTLQNSLAKKSDAPAYPDLSAKVRDLESRLAATSQQADSAVQTAVAASKQSTADLRAASVQITELKAALAAKPAPAAVPDLSGKVRDLENQLAAAETEVTRNRQEIVALARAKDEASKTRSPAYPNLAGRVVELQTELASTKHDLADLQTALRTAESTRATATPAAASAPANEPAASTGDTSELQKQLTETEGKLATALRGYALLQQERDALSENAGKSSDAGTTERNTLANQVSTLTAEVEQLKGSATGQAAAAQAEVTRANESLAALQRSTAQNITELAAAKALLQQLQGTNTVLANENYQLKTRLSPRSPTTPASASTTPVAAPPATRTHVITAGDTLFRISQKYYGTPNRWQEIYQANTAKLGTNGVLRVGSELAIP